MLNELRRPQIFSIAAMLRNVASQSVSLCLTTT